MLPSIPASVPCTLLESNSWEKEIKRPSTESLAALPFSIVSLQSSCLSTINCLTLVKRISQTYLLHTKWTTTTTRKLKKKKKKKKKWCDCCCYLLSIEWRGAYPLPHHQIVVKWCTFIVCRSVRFCCGQIRYFPHFHCRQRPTPPPPSSFSRAERNHLRIGKLNPQRSIGHDRDHFAAHFVYLMVNVNKRLMWLFWLTRTTRAYSYAQFGYRKRK